MYDVFERVNSWMKETGFAIPYCRFPDELIFVTEDYITYSISYNCYSEIFTLKNSGIPETTSYVSAKSNRLLELIFEYFLRCRIQIGHRIKSVDWAKEGF